MKKNQSIIISMAVFVMLVMLVGQASAGGTANAIAAKESGLRKALANHLKNAARKEGLKNFDGSSLVINSDSESYGVAALVSDRNGVIAIAYFDTKELKGLYTIEKGESDFFLRELGGDIVGYFDIKKDPSVEPVISIDSTDPDGRRIWCFPDEDGFVDFCGDLDGLPF